MLEGGVQLSPQPPGISALPLLPSTVGAASQGKCHHALPVAEPDGPEPRTDSGVGVVLSCWE